MARIVTVHGTSEGLVNDQGELWWQHDSRFQARLCELLDLHDAELVPFHWGVGENSASARRRAGLDLYHLLSKYDEAGEDYYLIGHSHGGSVIYNALLQSAARNRRLKRLQAWCTVGTPFIDIAPKRFLFSRLSPPGLVVYLVCMVLIVSAASLLVSHFAGLGLARMLDEQLRDAAMGHLYVPLLALACSAALSAHIALYIYDRYVNRWFSDTAKRRAADMYAGAWIGMFHADDEAIAALRGAEGFAPQIVPRTFLAQAFAFVPVVIVVGLLAAVLYHLEMRLLVTSDDAVRLRSALLGLAPDVLAGLPGWLPRLTDVIWWSAALAAIFILATVIVAAFKVVGSLLGAPLAGLIDRIVWISVRQQIWGDDLIAETVRGVSVSPPMLSGLYRPLPGPVADAITAISDDGASATLHRLRAELGAARAAAVGADLLTGALSQLSWRELIHTTYFEADALIRLIALSLHLKGLAPLRSTAWAASETAATRRALVDMTVDTPARAGDVERVGTLLGPLRKGLDLSVTQKTLLSIAILVGLFVGGMMLTATVLPLAGAVAIWVGGAVGVVFLAELLPVRTRDLAAAPSPASSFEAAIEQFRDWAGTAEAELHPRCKAYVLSHDCKTRKCYVLVHGISNCPFSMIDFAPRLHALGHNVLVARLPYNGHLDNGTDALRHITAAELRAFSDTCVDIASGLGERVSVMGISAGGVIAAWMGQNRPEIEHAVLVAPAFGLSSFGTGLNHALMRIALLVPNFSVWKDPLLRTKARTRPHSYKRQSSRGIGELMRLGLATHREASRRRAAASTITLVTNAADTAVDPVMSLQLVARWRRHGTPVAHFEFGREHNLPHELIDPTEEGAKTALVYPKLIELAERTPLVTGNLPRPDSARCVRALTPWR